MFLLLNACGVAPYQIENETDRNSMIYTIRNHLTVMNCADALDLSTRLFESSYSNNEIRMLYASAHGCNVGIQLYPLIDEILVSNFGSINEIFRSFVRLFPSRTLLDSKLQSTWVMQDVLQSVQKPGVVIAASDQNILNPYNTGSLLYRDRTDDANSFLVFASMAGIGTSLNRYGYAVGVDPATVSYDQDIDLIWTSQALIKSDASHAGCSLASSMLNLFDGINAISTFTSGNISAAFAQILTIQAGIEAAGLLQCNADGFSNAVCDLASARLRYRDACFEQDAAASYAAGIIQAINAGWVDAP